MFGFHTQPRKTTRNTNLLKLVRGGGKGKRAKTKIDESRFKVAGGRPYRTEAVILDRNSM